MSRQTNHRVGAASASPDAAQFALAAMDAAASGDFRAAQHAASVALHTDRVQRVAASGGSLRKSKYVPRSLAQHSYTDRSCELPVPDGAEYVRSHPAATAAVAAVATARGGVTTLFPVKLHQVIGRMEADGHGQIMSWQPHGRAFVVHRPREFEGLMSKYFGKMKFSSFQRQLNLYGFMRLTHGPDKGGYYNEYFLRGKEFLAHRIQRIRVKGTGSRAASNPDQEPNFYAMIPVGCDGAGADQQLQRAAHHAEFRGQFEARQIQQQQQQRMRQQQMQMQQQRAQLQQGRAQLQRMAQHPQQPRPMSQHSSSVLPALVPKIAPPAGGFSELRGPPPSAGGAAGLPYRQISADSVLGSSSALPKMAPPPLQRSSSVAAMQSSSSSRRSPEPLNREMLAQMRADQQLGGMMHVPPVAAAPPERRGMGPKQVSLREDDLRRMLEKSSSSSSLSSGLPPRPQVGGLRRSSSAVDASAAAAAEEVPSSSEHDDLLSGDALSENDDDLRWAVGSDEGEGGGAAGSVAVEPLSDSELDDNFWNSMDNLFESSSFKTQQQQLGEQGRELQQQQRKEQSQQQQPPPSKEEQEQERPKNIMEELESLPEEKPSEHGIRDSNGNNNEQRGQHHNSTSSLHHQQSEQRSGSPGQRAAFSMRRLSASLSQISEAAPLSAPPPPVDGDIADFLRVLFEKDTAAEDIIQSANEEKESSSSSSDSDERDVPLGGSWNAATFARRGTFKRKNSWSNAAA